MPAVTRAQLEALIDHQRFILRGREYSAASALHLADLGPLATLVADADGWRRDGTAATRRFLAALLERWAEGEADGNPHVLEPATDVSTSESGALLPARGGRVATARQVADVLRRLWGISEPPLQTAASLAAELGARPVTVRSWPARVLRASLADAEALLPTTTPATRLPETLRGSPADWRGSPSTWPPVGTGDAIGDRELLFDRLRAVVPDTAGGGDGATRLALIRRQAAALLRTEYFGDPSSDLVRDIDRGILDVWDDQDVLLFDATPGPDTTRGRLPRRVIAIVQMFCFEATAPDQERGRQLAELLGIRRSGARFVTRAEALSRRAQRGDVGRVLRDAVVQGLRAVGRSGARRVVVDETLTRLLGPRPLDSAGALAVSNYLRTLTTDDKRVLLAEYVAKRERFADADADFTLRNKTPVAQMRYTLADQGVDLEILNLHDEQLAARMAKVIASGGSSYAIFPDRNEALSASKSGRHAYAVALVERVFERAEELIADGTISDPVEQLETLHQISLAATGILTATVEARLAVRRAPADQALREYVVSLLSWTVVLRGYLRQLADVHGALPATRHEDGRHIFWRDWAFTTAQNRLRALIVAHTAREAVPGIVLPRGGDLDAELDSVLEAYRDVVVSPDLSENSEGILVMQATWLAFLNGGRLPAVRSGISPVLARIKLLDGAPSGMSTDDPMLDFRHRASAEWHIRRGEGGKLAELRRSSLAWAHLRAVGGSDFEEWYTLLEGAGLTLDDPPSGEHRSQV